MKWKNINQTLIPVDNEARAAIGKVPNHDLIDVEFTGERRTSAQNNAMHLYCDLVAKALNDAGLEIKKLLGDPEKAHIDIPWNKETVKELIWKPIQKYVNQHESTAEAGKKDYNQVYEIISREVLAENGVPHIPFPNFRDIAE